MKLGKFGFCGVLTAAKQQGANERVRNCVYFHINSVGVCAGNYTTWHISKFAVLCIQYKDMQEVAMSELERDCGKERSALCGVCARFGLLGR